MFDCLSRQNYPLVPAKSWESLVGVGKHMRKQVPFVPIKQCIAGTWLSIDTSISRKWVATLSYPFGYRKSGLSRKGCLSGSSAPACGGQRVQGNDLEYNSVFNWASGAQGQCAPFAMSCGADTDLVPDQLEFPAPFVLVSVSRTIVFKGCQSTTFHDN